MYDKLFTEFLATAKLWNIILNWYNYIVTVYMIELTLLDSL